METMKTIFPLNLVSAKYNRLPDTPSPDGVSIAVIAMVKEGVDSDRLESRIRGISLLALPVFERELLDPLEILRRAPCKIEGLSVCSHYGALTPELIAQMPAEQQSWIYEGIYFQTVFFRDRSVNNDQTHDGAAIALTLEDGWIARSHSLFPEDHLPLPVPIAFGDDYEDAVGDLFAKGVALWNRDLISLRNEIQIAVRAWDTGENAAEKLHEFRSNGKEYFLF